MIAAREIHNIIRAYEAACTLQQQSVLATIVQVEGSSYRKPGARMLICENGELTGAVSGGCLENDIRRKAMLVMTTGNPILVTYDSMDDEDEKPQVATGCNGIIKIWLELLKKDDPNNPVTLLKQFLQTRKPATLATIFSEKSSSGKSTGLSLVYPDANNIDTENHQVREAVLGYMHDAYINKYSALVSFTAAGKSHTAYIDYLIPPVAILIVGAGNDAIPVARLSAILGWGITVVDGRPTYATAARFPMAEKLVITKPENILSGVVTDRYTVAILMTHNYNYDLDVLQQLVNTDITYIGILGPRKKQNRLLLDLEQRGITLTQQQQDKIHGPAGLDIGAESPEEISLSIIAEIKKILSGYTGELLKDKKSPIHAMKY